MLNDLFICMRIREIKGGYILLEYSPQCRSFEVMS